MNTLRSYAIGVVAVVVASCSLVNDPARFQGGLDAGVDAPMIDAGPRVRVRVLNAIGYQMDGDALASIDVDIEGDERAVTFGCVETFSLPPGAHLATITVEGSSTMPALGFTEDTLVIIARDAVGAVATYRISDVPPTATPGRFALRYLNVLRQSATEDANVNVVTNIQDVAASTVPLPFGTWSVGQEYPAAVPASVGLLYPGAPFVSPALFGSFTTPLTASTFMVLSGDAHAHPSAANGPRGVLVPPPGTACGTPVLPDPQIALVNLSLEERGLFGDPDIFGCALDTSFAAVGVNANAVSLTVPVFGTLTRFGLGSSGAIACDAAMAEIVSFSGADALSPGHRYLIAVAGAIRGDPDAWTISVVEEAVPTAVAEMGATFAHFAQSTAPFAVDLRGTSMLYSTNLALNAWDPRVIDSTLFVNGPWEVTQSAPPMTLVGSYSTSVDQSNPGGAFFVLFDQRVATVPEPKVAFIRSAYGRQWGIDIARR